MIGLELEVLAKKLDRFGWDRDRNTPAHDRILSDWMDVLQDYPLDEIRAACKYHIADNPNKMPNEGHIVALILRARKRVVRKRPKQEPERVRLTADEANAILAQVGFSVRRTK